MDIDALLTELVALARREPSVNLWQFKTRVSGEQYRLLYELIERHVPRGAAVLDWGCGNGHASYALNALGYAAQAYSIDDAPPPLASHLPNVRFTTGTNVVRLPFDDASFDAVLSVGVLEHVREEGGREVDSMREIRRVLKPHGVFLCYHLPNRYSYIDAIAKVLPGTHHHQYRFTKRSIRELCDAAGFELIDAARYAAFPRNPWQIAPAALANSKRVAAMWNAIDRIAAIPLAPIAQNYFFVARVTSSAPATDSAASAADASTFTRNAVTKDSFTA